MIGSRTNEIHTARATLWGGLSLLAVALFVSGIPGPAPAFASPDRPAGSPRPAAGARGAASSTQGAGASSQAPLATPDLFGQTTLRDFYVTFKNADWLAELDKTDETGFVPADLTVDGVTYTGVGLRYKGNSSARIGGKKKPFGLGMDAFHDGQKLYGYDTLNLNNSFLDPSYLREVLTYDALRPFLPTPRATFVKLHLNGDYWGLYVLVQQLEKSFTGDWFADKDGILVKADAPAGMGGPVGPRPPFAMRESGPGAAITRLSPRPPAAADGAPQIMDRTAAVSRVGAVQQQPGPPPGGGGFNSALTWLGEDLSRYKSAYEVKTGGTGDSGYTVLQTLTRQLDAPVASGGLSDASFPAQIGEVLDVDGALWYIAAHNLFANFDCYYSGHNYFIYASRTDPRWTMLSWDMNEAFGLFRLNGVSSASTAGLAATDPFLAETNAARPLIRRLFAVPGFRADYIAHYRALAATAMNPSTLETKGRSLQQLIRAAVETDPNKLYDFALFEKSLMDDVQVTGSTGGGPARGFTPGVLALAKARQAWVQSRADMASPALSVADHSVTPSEPTVGEPAAIAVSFDGADAQSVQSARLVYRAGGASPRSIDMLRTNIATWQATVPAQRPGDEVTYYVRVTMPDGRSDFWPAANWTKPWHYRVKAPNLPKLPGAAVVINELMADNGKTIADEAGQFEDWLELVNRGHQSVSLGGLLLGSSPNKPWELALPDVTLAPGEHYLVWCDGDTAAGANHAPFKLSKAGDRVVLANRTNLLDDVQFEVQETDVSYARLTDGTETWGACASPSPGRTNRCGGGAEGGQSLIYLPAVKRE